MIILDQERVNETKEFDHKLELSQNDDLYCDTVLQHYAWLKKYPRVVTEQADDLNMTIEDYLNEKVNEAVDRISNYRSFSSLLDYVDHWCEEDTIKVLTNDFTEHGYIAQVYKKGRPGSMPQAWANIFGVYSANYGHYYTLAIIFHGKDQGWGVHS